MYKNKAKIVSKLYTFKDWDYYLYIPFETVIFFNLKKLIAIQIFWQAL